MPQVLRDRNNGWGAVYLNYSEWNFTVNIYSDALLSSTKILQEADTAGGTVPQKRCSSICG